MAPRRARSRRGTVNRNYLSQRQKLNAQRLPVYQGPSPAPVQGPSLTPQPSGTFGSRPVADPRMRPAPGPNIWEMGQRGRLKPAAPVAATATGGGGLAALGIPALIGGLLGIGSSMLFPAPAGKGSTLEAQGIDITPKSKPKPKPKPKPAPKKTKLSAAAIDFDKAFAKARAAGLEEFTWRGNRYHTRYAGE